MAIIRQILQNVPLQEAGRKEKTMATAGLRTCKWCGRRFDNDTAYMSVKSTGYCSEKCHQAGHAADAARISGGSSRASSGADIDSLVRFFKLIGIVFVALAAVFTVLCYKFPKFLAQKNKKFLYAYIIT
jgi:hypothetical protein